MVGEDDDVLLSTCLDPYQGTLNGLKADVGAVAFIGLNAGENLDDLLLNGQGLLVEALTKARPRDTFPNNRAALLTRDRFEMFIHN